MLVGELSVDDVDALFAGTFDVDQSASANKEFHWQSVFPDVAFLRQIIFWRFLKQIGRFQSAITDYDTILLILLLGICRWHKSFTETTSPSFHVVFDSEVQKVVKIDERLD